MSGRINLYFVFFVNDGRLLSPKGLGAKVKVRERSVVSLGCATRAKKAKLDTKVGRLLLKRNLNV